MSDLQFRANPAQGFNPWNTEGFVTPDIEHSEGVRPAGTFMVAPYLPQLRFDIKYRVPIVVSAGKILAFDSRGNIVPAGLAIELALGAASTLVYTQDDVNGHIKNASGVPVTVGEKVVTSMIAEGITVSGHIGFAPTNFFKHPGGDGENPVYYDYGGFNPQNKVGFVTDYVIRLPVAEAARYATAPLKGITALIAAANTVKPGQYVVFDKDSNLTLAELGYGRGATPENVVGQILQYSTANPALMSKIRSPTIGTDVYGSNLANLSGTATKGKEQSVYYANGYALATINVVGR